MRQNENYGRRLDELLRKLDSKKALYGEWTMPRLLLHACCAPCSSYCLEYLSRHFEITLLYYNPNISPREEFDKRAAEVRRLISELPLENPVELVVDEYNYDDFLAIAKGHEQDAEGGERCFRCYRLRLSRAAKYAAEHGFDYFCSTLSISPHKNAAKLNEIGEELSEIYAVPHLPNDFKKKGGYKRSIELSREYGLYRQEYCGCAFSRRESKQ